MHKSNTKISVLMTTFSKVSFSYSRSMYFYNYFTIALITHAFFIKIYASMLKHSLFVTQKSLRSQMFLFSLVRSRHKIKCQKDLP